MKPLFAANWKMNKTVKEAMQTARELKEGLKGIKDKEILVCPPFISLSELRTIFHRSNIQLGAQNMHYEDKGAFTGEISPLMLKELCSYVILGHSERRHIFDEDDYLINKKLHAALKHNLKPILCVGETIEERGGGKEKEVVEKQLSEGLKGVEMQDIPEITIAYEPVWAIGTGKTATPEEAAEMHRNIRLNLNEILGQDSEKIRIIYGGSVTPENVSSLMAKQEIQGALVGGASLDADKFVKICSFKADAE